MIINKGDQLISHPSILGDYSFGRSVVLITHSSFQDGFVGFVINKKLNIDLKNLLPEMNVSIPIYDGGPVENENLYFIHSIASLADSSLEITDGLYWGGDIERVKDWIRTAENPELYIRFFMGYSGWESGQLEDEIEDKVWILDQDHSYNQMIFSQEEELIWKEKINRLGGKLSFWQNAPENPDYN